MARDSHKVPYRGLNIGGQVISTLHRRPRKSTHFNTIRAEHRAHTGENTKQYITVSRNRVHEMRDMGNIISSNTGHMKLSTQARKTLNLVHSNPGLTGNELAKCVNSLAGIFRNRTISRDRSVLEVASTVTGSAFTSLSSRNARLPASEVDPQEAAAGPPVLGNAPPQCVQPLPANEGPDDMMEELGAPETPVVRKSGPSHQPAGRRTAIHQGTEVFCGLITPIKTPVKAPRNQPTSAVIKQDVEMDATFTGGSSPTPSLGPGFDLPALQESKTQPDVVAALEKRILAIMQEKEVLLEKEQYVLRKLSRNGQGSLSNIEAVTDRAVRQRDELRGENQELRAAVERLKSGVVNLQDKISCMQEKLDRAQGERIEMAQSRRRWIARMWALAGRIPGELRKKDAEIEKMREKLVDMHALLAQEQTRLQEVHGQFVEERKKRMDVEVEFEDSKTAHAQEIQERDLAGQRLRGQLMSVVSGLGSGAISI